LQITPEFSGEIFHSTDFNQTVIIMVYDRTTKLRKILGLLDLTTLEGTDTDSRVADLAEKALKIKAVAGTGPAAVCVYPVFVRKVSHLLHDSGIAVASVAGAFPSGQSPLHLRVAEVEYAVAEGAGEIDMVISRGKLIAGETDYIRKEIESIRKACGSAHLKVILETGELLTEERIRLASNIAIQSGADFIKTSTGKIQPAATPEAMHLMLQVIHESYTSTGKKTGIKPAGGISTPDQAIVYFDLVESVLGEEWLNPSLFRIGASRLADGILQELGISI